MQIRLLSANCYAFAVLGSPLGLPSAFFVPKHLPDDSSITEDHQFLVESAVGNKDSDFGVLGDAVFGHEVPWAIRREWL